MLYGRKGKPQPVAPPPPSPPKPISRYVPPEQWQENATAEEIRWEQRVQADAQRGGDRVRQNDIIGNELGKG